MGRNFNQLRAAAQEKIAVKDEAENKKIKTDGKNNCVDTPQKVKIPTKLFSIEAEVDDYDALMMTVLDLSNRDKVLYKKKDIYISMVKHFLKLVKNDIKSVKIEKY